jgi:iron complex transport system substrate-binding protein
LLRGQPCFEALRAVREGRLVLFDGHRFFNRPGPRLAETLEMLAEALHPALFDFGWEGRAFRRLAATVGCGGR